MKTLKTLNLTRNFLLKAGGIRAQQTAASLPEKASNFSENTPSPTIKKIDTLDSEKRKFLHVFWSDGTQSKFPFIWLKDNAAGNDTFYVTEKISARQYPIRDHVVDGQGEFEGPKIAKVAEDGMGVDLDWGQGPISYSSDWLQKRNLSNPKIGENRHSIYFENPKIWGSAEIRSEIDNPAYWDRMMEEDVYLADSLTRLQDYGILLVKGVPKVVGMPKKLGEKLGFLYPTHYGETFTVKNQAIAGNLAYTRDALPLHTDVGCLTRMPYIQMLHCLIQAGEQEGGENQFADGFQVATLLKKEKPEVHDILASTHLEFIEHGDNAFKHSNVHHKPTIGYDSRGKLSQIQYSDQFRTWFIDTDVDRIPEVYKALRTFVEYCYQPRNLLEFKLEPGDLVLFGNCRLLHGRAAYTASASSERHLEGAYLHPEAVQSTIRLVRRKQYGDQYQVLLC